MPAPESQQDAIQAFIDLANDIVLRGMSTPAIFFLESTKYMSFIGSQMLIFLGPIATCFINNSKYYNFAEIIENKNNIELLIMEIERLQSTLKA